MPLHSPFTGNILRKTKESINGNPFYGKLGQKIIKPDKNTSTKTLSENPTSPYQNQSRLVFVPLGEISPFRHFLRPFRYYFEEGSNWTTKARQTTVTRPGPKTRLYSELATSDNDTRVETNLHETGNRPQTQVP